MLFFFCFSNAKQLREQYQTAFTKKHGIKLGFMSAFVKATACALKEQPIVNAGECFTCLCQLCLASYSKLMCRTVERRVSVSSLGRSSLLQCHAAFLF